MFGSQALETGLGLLFFFLLFSLVVTALADIVAAFFRLKAKNLRKGLEALLQQADPDDPSQKRPNIRFQTVAARSAQTRLLSQTKIKPDQSRHGLINEPPAAIDRDSFVVGLIEGLFESLDTASETVRSIDRQLLDARNRSTVLLSRADEIIHALPESRLKRDLERYVSRAFETLGDFEEQRDDLRNRAVAVRKALSNWYDAQTAEIGDWYRQNMKWVTFLIGLAGAIAINANPIQVGQQLWAEPQITAGLNTALIQELDRLEPGPSTDSPSPQSLETATGAAAGDRQAQTGMPEDQDALIAEIRRLRAEIDKTQGALMAFPVGWTDQRWARHFVTPSWDTWLSSIVGWLIAAFAATLGAPFWFDLLKKVIALRSRVSERNEAASKDRAQRQAGSAQGG